MKLDAEKALKHLRVYEGAINAIDDYLEYRYKSMQKHEIRDHIIYIIDKLTKRLEKC